MPLLYVYIFFAWALLIALDGDGRRAAQRLSARTDRTRERHVDRHRHRPRVVRLRRAALRDRLLRRQARRRRPQHHREPVHLRAFARGLLHLVDVLRQRRPRGDERHRLPADLSRPDADGGAVVVRAASRSIRISKANRITSIADFIGSRYGKSQLLGGLVTIIAVLGIVPYIALQLKAISNSFSIILQVPRSRHAGPAGARRSSSGTTRSTSRCCSRLSRSSSAPAISTRPSATKAWSRRSPSSRW